MGKVLIAAFDDKDEIAFDELLLFLKSNSHIKVVNAFPNDSCTLSYILMPSIEKSSPRCASSCFRYSAGVIFITSLNAVANLL